mmetsp:Transcript_13428/g.50308  ORF Transcript_13428/g.50308 Transcript_13428/m.50308 type:complete len:251 (-) Transcript_13428:63-815(-)
MPVGKENSRKRNERCVGRHLLTITVIDGPTKGQSFDKQADALQIGRTRSSAVYLKDPAVSQVHAIIKWTGSEYTVTDLGSSNGTLVNDEECETDEAVVLKNGDLIVVGTDTTVKVTIVEADAVAEKKEQPAPKGAAARAAARGAAAAKREAEKAKKLEAAEAKKESVEKAKAAAKAKEEEALEKEKKKQQALETEKKPEHESMTVEKFLLNTVETMIAEVKDLAERACVDIGEETERIKTKLRAETRAAS